MSAIGGKADSPLTCCDVRFWPIADIVQSPLDQCLALRWGRQSEASGKRSSCDLVDNSHDQLPGLSDRASMRCGSTNRIKGTIMAKRKNGSKVQSQAKLRKANSAKRGKARKVAKAAKRTVAKPKRAPVKKAARKERMKQPVTAVVETVAADVIEQPAPGVVAVTEVEETEVRKAS